MLIHSTLPLRFWAKVRALQNGCWEWTASCTPKGYGHFNAVDTPGRKYVNAHRYAYLNLVGPIPDGMELDHLCRNRKCIRPHHLDVVTHAVNARRGMSPTVILWRWGVCRNGHPRSESYTRKGTSKIVFCRPCRRAQRARQRASERAGRPIIPCRYCGNPVPKTKRSNAVYCSAQCCTWLRHRGPIHASSD